MPRISVILPVFNAETTLDAAVASIQSQTLTDWELILVNDGSTDRSGQMIREYARQDIRIQPLSLPHGGIVSALNTGLNAARAPLLARMDADDIMLPQRLEKQAAWLEARPDTDVVGCLVRQQGAEPGYAAHVDWLNGLLDPASISLQRFIDAPLAHPSVMFRRSCLERWGGYRSGAFPEDYELWLRWLEGGAVIEKVPEYLLVWRDTPARLSRNHPRYAESAFARIRATYLFRWLEAHNPRHPEVVIWGAGRKTRRRLEPLLQQGISISAYLDVKAKNRQLDAPVLDFREIGTMPDAFVLSVVNSRGARQEIREFLLAQGRQEGHDFLIT